MRHNEVNYRHYINSVDIIGGNTVTYNSQHHALVYFSREVSLIKANQLSLDLKVFFISQRSASILQIFSLRVDQNCYLESWLKQCWQLRRCWGVGVERQRYLVGFYFFFKFVFSLSWTQTSPFLLEKRNAHISSSSVHIHTLGWEFMPQLYQLHRGLMPSLNAACPGYRTKQLKRSRLFFFLVYLLSA